MELGRRRIKTRRRDGIWHLWAPCLWGDSAAKRVQEELEVVEGDTSKDGHMLQHQHVGNHIPITVRPRHLQPSIWPPPPTKSDGACSVCVCVCVCCQANSDEFRFKIIWWVFVNSRKQQSFTVIQVVGGSRNDWAKPKVGVWLYLPWGGVALHLQPSLLNLLRSTCLIRLLFLS